VFLPLSFRNLLLAFRTFLGALTFRLDTFFGSFIVLFYLHGWIKRTLYHHFTWSFIDYLRSLRLLRRLHPWKWHCQHLLIFFYLSSDLFFSDSFLLSKHFKFCIFLSFHFLIIIEINFLHYNEIMPVDCVYLHLLIILRIIISCCFGTLDTFLMAFFLNLIPHVPFSSCLENR